MAMGKNACIELFSLHEGESMKEMNWNMTQSSSDRQ